MPIINTQEHNIKDLSALKELIRDNKHRLLESGYIRLRGYDFANPKETEEAITAISKKLETEYMGTSPRLMISDFFFTASELPGHYPIPQHCEMSFIKHPPRYLFFWCQTAPEVGSGETPTTDMRRVAEDIPEDMKTEFEKRGLKVIRNYAASGGAKDAFQLKPWDEIFKTKDKATVEETCRAQGFEPTWLEGDRLRLVSYQDAFNAHPETGEIAWFNHLQVFHRDGPRIEYDHISSLRPNLRSIGTGLLLKGLTAWKKIKVDSGDLAMHMTFGDGGEIPVEYVRAVSDAIWKHQDITPWQKNDLLIIDNRIASHGRLPYSSPRDIAVAWANG